MTGSQIGIAWLYTKLQTITALTDLIGSGANAKAYEAGKVPATTTFPYLVMQVVDQQIATPIGGLPNAWNTIVDLALWTSGNSDAALIPANDAIYAALGNCDPEMYSGGGYQVSCGAVMPLPPAPPPVTPGDPEVVRLGYSFEIFVGAA